MRICFLTHLVPLHWYLVVKVNQYKKRTVILQLNLPSSQNIVEDRFGAYDWQNNEENIKHYGQPSPPLYKLEKVFIVKQITNRLTGKVIINYFPQNISCRCFWRISASNLSTILLDLSLFKVCINFTIQAMNILCTGAFLYARYSLLLISNKFSNGGGGSCAVMLLYCTGGVG